MKTATLGQGRKILELIEETETPVEHLQKLIEGGYISDLLIANVDEMNRDKFRKVCGLIPISTGFPVFKTIKLGTNGLETADDFRKAIKDKRMRTGDYANNILPQLMVATEETEVNLAVVSVAELSFKDEARLKDIYARAKELGLELCPNEVGPQLRLQYVDQPKGEWLIIGMEPIAVSDGDLELFDVGHDGIDLWLRSRYGSPARFWHGRHRFVFVLPRK